MILSLYHCGVEIGKATAVWLTDKREMNIGDLGTDENHRGRSLGGLLLGQVEATARRRGATQITGRVVEKDRAAFPDLRGWYASAGLVCEVRLHSRDDRF